MLDLLISTRSLLIHSLVPPSLGLRIGMAATTSSASYELALPPTDALPYYDNEIDKVGMKAKVEREIAKEMKEGTQGKVSDDRLPPELILFKDRPDLAELMERANNRGTESDTSALDRTRYHLAPPEGGLQATEEDWKRSTNNAEAQLIHSEARLTNLELLKKYGANNWRLHNFQQEAFLRQYQQASTEIQDATTALNRRRKASQVEAGNELTRLNKRWAELLNRSLNVEFANIAIMTDIEDLEARKSELQRKLDAQEA